MERDTCASTEPGTIAGVLKTVYLFLEGQQLRQTCLALLEESILLGYPNFRDAMAHIVVLKPSIAEVVRVSYANPRRDSLEVIPELHPNNTTDVGTITVVTSAMLDLPTVSTMAQCAKSSPVAGTGLVPQRDNRKRDLQIVHQAVAEEVMRAPNTVEANRTAEAIASAEFQPLLTNRKTTNLLSNDAAEHQSSGFAPQVESQVCAAESPKKVMDEEWSLVNFEPMPEGIHGLDMLHGVEKKRVNSHVRTITDNSTISYIKRPSGVSFQECVTAFSSDSTSQHNKCTKCQCVTPKTSEKPEHKTCNNSESAVADPLMSDVNSSSSCKGATSQNDSSNGSLERMRKFDKFDLDAQLSREANVQVETVSRQMRPSYQSDELPWDSMKRFSTPESSKCMNSLSLNEERSHSGEHGTLIDYNKLKSDMKTKEVQYRLLLLQALRWKITQSSPAKRITFLFEVTKYDLLGLHGAACNNPYPLLKTSLYPEESPSQLQEGMARLLNAIASTVIGRDYLCQDDNILRQILVPLVTSTHPNRATVDETTREFLLVILQKLSLRNKMRLVMVECGLAEYLVRFISENYNKLSDYCLEYTSALFMNLCLHNEARVRLQSTVSVEVIKMLKSLLQSSHTQCLPYINGAMYSLFGESKMKQLAVEGNVSSVLSNVKNHCNEEVLAQVELILDILSDKKTRLECIDCECIDDHEEFDHLEPEIDLGDKVSGIEHGDLLLAGYVTNVNKDPAIQSLECTCKSIAPYYKPTANVSCFGLHPNLTRSYVNETASVAIKTGKKHADSNLATILPPHVDKKRQKTESKQPVPSPKASKKWKPRASSRTDESPVRDSSATNKNEKSTSTQARLAFAPPTMIYQPLIARSFACPACYSRKQSKYTCECYDQIKSFVTKNCQLHCPSTSANQCNSNKKCEQKNYTDEELFQSAVELLAATNCCKFDAGLTPRVDCECYTTVFQSRPKVTRTP